MGEVARHDETTMGFDGVRLTSAPASPGTRDGAGTAFRLTADDGAARSIALLVLAVAIVALAAGLLLESSPEPTPAPIEDASSHARSVAAAQVGAQTAPGVPPGHATRIAAFPAPGARPIERGIVVRDDFELPPGYVGHD